MRRLHYISPSVLPSRYANSVHVMHQCNGFSKSGVSVILYAKRAIKDKNEFILSLQDTYGIDVRSWKLHTYYSSIPYADTLRIAIMSLLQVLSISKDLMLTRNLYAAWIFACIHKPFLYETHQLEIGFKKLIQRFVMTRPWIRTVVISDNLVHCLNEHHQINLKNPLVLHDAAPDGIERLNPQSRRCELGKLFPDFRTDFERCDTICGYFGQLYAGRGLDVIEAMAKERPACLFLVFGGNDSEVSLRSSGSPSNLRFMGHIQNSIVLRVQAAMDVLLMPYQRSVSIGMRGHDTARWMSPMKMFEYLAAGVPIISSDLPVLKEVLKDKENALLVEPDCVAAWVAALDMLVSSPELAEAIGSCAHDQYQSHHTWSRRAKTLLDAALAL